MKTNSFKSAFSHVNRQTVRALLIAACIHGNGFDCPVAFGQSTQTALPAAALPALPAGSSTVGISMKPLPEASLPPGLLPAPTSLPKPSTPLLPAPTASQMLPATVPTSAGSSLQLPPTSSATNLPSSISFPNAVAPASDESPKGRVGVKLIGDVALPNEPARMPSLPPANDLSAPPAMIKQEKTGPVKFSLDDSRVLDLGDQRSQMPPTISQRTPELVKPKKYSVSSVVAVSDAKDPSAALGLHTLPKPVANGISEANSVGKPAPSLLPASPTSSTRQTSVASALPSATSAPSPQTNRTEVARPATPESGFVPAPAIPASRETAYRKSTGYVQPASSNEAVSAYDIDVLGTYSIDSPVAILSATAQHPDVCKVFHNSNTITIVGSKVGKTNIEIQLANRETRVVAFKVLPTGQKQSGSQTDVDQVKAMISQHFPTAKISFVKDDSGAVTVKGTAGSEADARKILELVRKVCLVPVYDKVQVAAL